MNVSRLVRQVHVLWRSERIIAELRLKRLLGSMGLQALAALMIGVALLLFEFAAYLGLVRFWDAIASAALLGLVNLVIAGLLMSLALRRPASRELALANEVHREAVSALETELRGAEAAGPASLCAALERAAIPLLLPLIPLMIARLRGMPGVTAAGAADGIPFAQWEESSSGIEIIGHPPTGVLHPHSLIVRVTPGYFSTIGIALVAGRFFTDADRRGAPKVAIVD